MAKNDVLEGEVLDDDSGLPAPVLDQAMIGGLTRAEIDIQIATAHKFPRVISNVKRQIVTLATLDQETAEACFFRLPRRQKDPDTGQWVNKFIEGPSIRFAEIVLASYGNARVASRRTNLGETDVEATGIFHDLENNVAQAKSVTRSIMTAERKDKSGRVIPSTRFTPDMINTTTNAAAAIALRNAILAGVPRGYWKEGLTEAMRAARGDQATLTVRREQMIKKFAEQDVTRTQLFELLGVRGQDDITLDIMFDATGILTALVEKETTIDALLREARGGEPGPSLDDAAGKSGKGPAAKPPGEQKGKAAAQPADKPKDTKGSATDAAGPSAEASSGPQASSGSSDAAEPEKAPDGGQMDAERQPEGDQDEGGAAEAGAEEPTEEDLTSLRTLAHDVQEAQDLVQIRAAVERMRASGVLERVGPEDARDALLTAAKRAEAINETLFAEKKAKPDQDPWFYRLWIMSADPRDVRSIFRVLMRSAAYNKLSEAEQDVLLDETDAITKI